MEILRTTSLKRETYQVQLKASLLWECALGIAAVTNDRLIDTLDKPKVYWDKMRESLPDALLYELNFVETHNTWKALLQLLHQRDFSDLNSFIEFIENLSEKELKFICLPYVGQKYQEMRRLAVEGDHLALNDLKVLTESNPFFPEYISFISQADPAALKKHLINVIEGWHEQVIESEADRLSTFLNRDVEAKKNMLEKMGSEEFVEWATGGITYKPEPSVHHVLLIPQYIYRPWNIEADIEDTKVFYYPIANESIDPDDHLTPDYFLVHKHKALGDGIRLRIVKLLVERDHTLQEITNILEMGKTTVHHHLKILRSARLVGVHQSKYTLKKNAITTLSKELEYYLNGK